MQNRKCADCRKRIADGTSKGGAAAASADNNGDVAAVMEVDEDVMGTEDDKTSTVWCFGVTSLCAAVGSEGCDEHLCTPKFADLISTSPDRSPTKRPGDLRSENCTHVGWTDRRQAGQGGNGHIPSC